MIAAGPRCRALLRRFGQDRSGLALLEFALALPLVLGIGLYGVETANLALANMKISQIALNLADNTSRVGMLNSLNIEQLREVDVDDVLAAAGRQGASWDLGTRGRITISSLEADSSGNQVIHWQRCLGMKSGTNYDSSYGITATTNRSDGTVYDPNAGVDTTAGSVDNASSHPGSAAVGVTGNTGAGMGEAGAKVIAPPSSGVIFVEINYDYKPVVSAQWLAGGAARIHYIASFIVRDRRDFTEIYNPDPGATRMTCDKHTAS